MAKVGAQRAAELTGRSKSTIQRAMKAGKISFEIDNNGRRVIDVAELDRAFGLVPQDSGKGGNATVEAELEKATAMLEAERLKMRVRMLEEQLEMAHSQIADLKTQRDQWQKQAQQVLLTSQYSQKQAEEMKAEIKARDERARVRRQKEIEMRRQQQIARNGGKAVGKGRFVKGENENRKIGPMEQQRMAGAAEAVKNFDIQGLWQKIRGQDEKSAETDDTRKIA